MELSDELMCFPGIGNPLAHQKQWTGCEPVIYYLLRRNALGLGLLQQIYRDLGNLSWSIAWLDPKWFLLLSQIHRSFDDYSISMDPDMLQTMEDCHSTTKDDMAHLAFASTPTFSATGCKCLTLELYTGYTT